jgi:CheY-like chemotaxis protein
VTLSVDKQVRNDANPLADQIIALKRQIAELERASDAAVAANLAKTRYLVGVSHEIRSPLNAIYGYAQMLERGGNIDPLEAGRVIRCASEHLTNIVDGLLDISRIESGVHKIERDVFALPQFLDAVIAMMRGQAKAKGLQLDCVVPRNIPAHVSADEKRLRQMLVNLISNAIKYTQSGSVTVTLRYTGMIADFSVADTGIGIAASDYERIFEPFCRGTAELAQQQPGTGLGLAITRLLAQIMGGDVSVSSTVGVGSVFRLKLLLPEARGVIALRRPPGDLAGYAGPRQTVLVIDDDLAHRRAVEALLGPLGFTVHSASSGAEGLALAMRHSPDLALVDIQLGDSVGWDVVRRIRARENGTQTARADAMKIVIVSANAHELSGGGPAGAGHDGAVMKPVRFDALLDEIAEALQLTWQSAPGTGSVVPTSRASDLLASPERIERLRYLGQIGHLQAINDELDALADEDLVSTVLVDALRAHAERADLTAFIALLDADG